jgi:long-chain acyl-CoA synthetase
MPRLQLDLETALTQLNVSTPFVLVGHSFGGAVVTDYAINHPDHVEKLILIATAGEFKLNPLLKLGLNLPHPVLRIIGPLYTRSWLHAPPHASETVYHQNMSKWIGWEKFANLQVPTMVIRGHRDYRLRPSAVREGGKSIPGAEDVDVRVSGHMVMLERRAAVDRSIASFSRASPKNRGAIHPSSLRNHPVMT